MNTHQKFAKCQEELLLKHIRFFKGEQPGVGYLDIASVVSPHMVNMTAYDGMKSLFDKHSYDTIVAVEGDAWLYAQPLALEYGKEIVLARRLSGLPYRAICEDYQSPQGTRTLELEANKLDANGKVLIVNSVIATGQMTAALVRLVQRAGARLVGVAALASLDYLPRGVFQLPADVPVRAVLHYDELPEV